MRFSSLLIRLTIAEGHKGIGLSRGALVERGRICARSYYPPINPPLISAARKCVGFQRRDDKNVGEAYPKVSRSIPSDIRGDLGGILPLPLEFYTQSIRISDDFECKFNCPTRDQLLDASTVSSYGSKFGTSVARFCE